MMSSRRTGRLTSREPPASARSTAEEGSETARTIVHEPAEPCNCFVMGCLGPSEINPLSIPEGYIGIQSVLGRAYKYAQTAAFPVFERKPEKARQPKPAPEMPWRVKKEEAKEAT